MKVFKSEIRVLFLLIFALFGWSISARSNSYTSPCRISLLTCGPGQEVYSLYGHTAIRVQSSETGDIVVNYGMFSFKQKYFILRFVFGLTDYQMGVMPFDVFMEEYREEGRWVEEQQLNLDSAECRRIIVALQKNYGPENRTYRYNYFYDNCTTRARDILIGNLNGKVRFPDNHKDTSYREMIHSMNETHPWARFGNDLLLGLKADRKTNNEQQQFLPEHLMKDFDHAVVANGSHQHNLVSGKLLLLSAQTVSSNDRESFTPRLCTIAFFLCVLIIILVERKTKKRIWLFDFVWMLIDGMAGLILFAMIFSQHPTVSLNLQILLLNPLSLVFGLKAVLRLRKHQVHWFLKAHAVCIVIFLLGAFVQTYAEGMITLALSLLIRELYLIRAHE